MINNRQGGERCAGRAGFGCATHEVTRHVFWKWRGGWHSRRTRTLSREAALPATAATHTTFVPQSLCQTLKLAGQKLQPQSGHSKLAGRPHCCPQAQQLVRRPPRPPDTCERLGVAARVTRHLVPHFLEFCNRKLAKPALPSIQAQVRRANTVTHSHSHRAGSPGKSCSVS